MYFWLDRKSKKRKARMEELANRYGLKNIFHRHSFLKCMCPISTSTNINIIEGKINNHQVKIIDKILSGWYILESFQILFYCSTSIEIDGKIIKNSDKFLRLRKIRFIPIDELNTILTKETNTN
ncbi:MAG: hypothetical protein NTY11_01690 [Candidatus Parcubacteria bacterium]|nr:hypothetical protein [Candidatus Parcubacteria bacterium]